MAHDPGIPLIEHLAARLPELRRSERKVAELVASDPAFVVNATMAAVADAAGVTDPTVMRFATALGFDGFQQFRLALAQSLALGMPATLSTISPRDSAGELSTKVFDHTISSLDRARRALDPEQIERSVVAILAANSVTFLGLGASAIIAADAAQKSPHFGVPCLAPGDPHQQFMAAAVSGPGHVFVAISNTGETSSILDIATAAKGAGATVICITGEADSSLVGIVDIPIIVRTFEDTDTLTPSVSRLAGLVVVDILATAVSLRRGSAHAARLASMKEQLASFRRSRVE
ncbi:MurR/RpiR family transcriptional regulator [Salinibacterium sp. G-O1]|uniref:SIS domain-containing protein n=1 Tax=Salinibacterium sp. G-O1 TaxID=3046208 RepID=UPI0024B9E20D|nr:MurR/RpiR family transcriptional regulator [Salinibacterium sp. G-O1]MDJ0334050.1 MurR/RpiR family transcriptional regulator [Salinibacterium sp. G-O1]